jgi:hypothetical protein
MFYARRLRCKSGALMVWDAQERRDVWSCLLRRFGRVNISYPGCRSRTDSLCLRAHSEQLDGNRV